MTQPKDNPLSKIIWQAMGEESMLFMSSPEPGTQQIMPVDQLKKLGVKTQNQILDLFIEIVGEDFKNWGELETDEQRIESAKNEEKQRIRTKLNNLRGEV